MLLCSAKLEPDLYRDLAFISILTIKCVLGKQNLLVVTSYVGASSGGPRGSERNKQPTLVEQR